jgi:hypothetical protein
MAVRLITYDLNKEPDSEDYKHVLEIIRSYAYARLSESSYAIQTEETPRDVYNQFVPYLDENDYFLVLTLTKPYYGFAQQEVHDWLEEKLPF